MVVTSNVSVAYTTSSIAPRQSSISTSTWWWVEFMYFATISEYARSGDPSKPIEKVFNLGYLPDSLKYFIIKAATNELSSPPDKNVPIGLSLNILFIVPLYNNSAVYLNALSSS